MRLPRLASRENSRKSDWIMGIKFTLPTESESSIDSFQSTEKKNLLLHHFKPAEHIHGRAGGILQGGRHGTPKLQSFTPHGRRGQTLFAGCLVNHNRDRSPLCLSISGRRLIRICGLEGIDRQYLWIVVKWT